MGNPLIANVPTDEPVFITASDRRPLVVHHGHARSLNPARSYVTRQHTATASSATGELMDEWKRESGSNQFRGQQSGREENPLP